MIATGRLCPRCGERTHRTRTPALLRPLRILVPSLTCRRCYGCGWRGIVLRARVTEARG